MIHRYIIAAGAMWILGASLRAQVHYANPVLAGDYPDPSIIRVGSDYWATATSSEWAPHFPILHSNDMVNWQITGHVFEHAPAWASGSFWAPEIAESGGKYFIYYVARQTANNRLAVAVATADHPAGPYTDHGILVAQEAGSIDPVPFTDGNGVRWLLWKEDGNSRKQPTPIWMQRLRNDGLALEGERQEILRNDSPWEGAVVEGPFVLRHGDYYYLFYSGGACCGQKSNYALGVARAKDMTGPWGKAPANPILAGNAAWRSPGHGSIVVGPDGRYRLLYHAYDSQSFVFTGRELMLDEVVFDALGWPGINGGQGPSLTAPSPFGAEQRRAELSFTDDFGKTTPDRGWQWPQDNLPLIRRAEGQLILGAAPSQSDAWAAAVYARSTTGGDYVSTTCIALDQLKSGMFAGFAAYGDAANAIGLSIGDGKAILWNRHQGLVKSTEAATVNRDKAIHLRMEVMGGRRFVFSLSDDGKVWKPVGDPVFADNLAPWDRSVRVALVCGGVKHAEARFTSFDLRSIRSAPR